MQIELVAISSLVLDPANARKHEAKDLDVIKGSLARFGQQKPIVVKGNVVRAGNGTLEAARQLGWDKISVVRTELEGSELLAYALVDNRSAELSTWDDEILSKSLKALQDINFDLEAIGFDKIEAEVVGNTDPDAVPETAEGRVKFGDLWTLGSHRLLCGDSTNVQHVERLMGGEKASIFLTDPPYGVSYADKNSYLNAIGRGNRIQVRIENDHGSIEESGTVWFAAYKAALANCAGDASFYIFSPQGGDLMMMMMIRDAGWTLKHMLVWVKNNHVLGRCDYHYKHEPIFYGWAKTHKFYGGSSCFSVLQYPKPLKNDLHPTMKPVELLEHLVGNSTQKGGAVLDLFLGSGSTLIACEKTNRRCFGMEIDPHYCDVIVARWEKYTGKQASLIQGQDTGNAAPATA